MATDKEYSTNDEVKRSEDFQKRVNLKESIIEFLKENLISVTDSVFQKAGYTKNEKSAGEYGDGSKYGAGAVENQYIVTVAGKTKSVLTKKIIMDGKSISSDIEIDYKDNVVEFNYLTTEQGFFRGVDKNKKTYTVNEKFALDSNDMNNLKNELKSKLKDFAEKELGYITNTKIGVADKSNKSTSSVVENKTLNMKKLTIKELFEMDDDNFDSIENNEPNSDKIKDLNTIDLRDTNPHIDSDKQLFFDEKELNETGEWSDDEEGIAWKESLRHAMNFISKKTNGKMNVIDVRGFDKYQGPYAIVSINDKKYQVWNTDNNLFWIENFPVDNTSEKGLNSGFEGTMEDIINVINGNYDSNKSMTLKTIPGTSFSMNESDSQIDEVTTSGPVITGSEGGYKDGAQSGAGGYNTKNAWKKTPYAKAQQKRPKVTHDYKVVAQESEDESKNKKSSSKLQDVAPKSTGKDTKIQQPSNKNNGVVEPESENNFNPKHENPTYTNTNQTKTPKSSNDDFWTEVDLIPGSGYVPKGMDKNYIAGLHDRPGDAKRLGLSEDAKPDLTKKKFFSLNENKEKGINKRYLITEKTTEEYEKDRFKKLSNFKTRESIKEAEEMNTFFDALQENKDPKKVFTYKKTLTENTSYDDFFNEESVKNTLQHNGEETIDVEKPGSKFGLTYKFFKSDFLNENKSFILDLNSRVYVKNPNSGTNK